MNIHELDSYNLGDAVKFNDRLNPRIWGADEKMRPEVREQLLKIADDFREFLGIDVEVKDITVSGSNAAYTYTPHSDIDLHLVVDLPEADANEVYRELFDAKKYAYNEQHDIRIGGYDVELYVQDANKTHHSQGIYSLVNNDWVSVPKRRKPDVDDISVKSKFEDLGHRIEAAIRSGDYDKINDLASKIKDYRQAGLDAHGEFGPENLAFKILRTQGLIKKLYDARNAAKDQLLSLDERKKKRKKKVKYGYGGYWYPGYAYAGQDHPAGSEGGDGGGDGGGESVREDAGMTWDGVNPTTDMFTSEDATMTWDGVNPSTAMFTTETEDRTDEDILRDFVDFCVKELKIEDMPRVKLRRDPQWPAMHKTFGRYNDETKTLEVAWGQRHIMDILRTVAHELTHKHQHEREGERMGPDAGETGSPYENEANARAGVLMRDYGRLHPEYFAVGQAHDLEEGWKQNVAAGILGAGMALGSAPSQAEIGNMSPAQLEYSLKRAELAEKYVEVLIQRAREDGQPIDPRMMNAIKAKASDMAAKKLQNQGGAQQQTQSNFPSQGSERMTSPNYSKFEESASGYIPTRAQAKDPRFSMALTVDIKPGQVGKEANKLKLKTDRQGHPQIARANGLFENLYKEYKKYKADEDYSPDEPPGPESKPTMPAGTLRVDVSDVYDWYKLGQHISNMKGLGKHDFGKGPPSAIISFGDEDTEHEFIGDLEATGLDVTDIDPADPVKRPGKKVKTDPTYNVDEAIQAPIGKNKDAEQYYKFIIGKAKLGRPLTRAEQDYVKMYQMYRQQKLAEGAPPPGLVVKKGGDWSSYPGGFQINAFLPNDKHVGMMVVYPRDDGQWIGEHLIVDPEYQRQGIATALWNFAEKTVGGRVIAINTTAAGKKFQRSRKQAVAEVKARYEMTDLDPWTFDQTPAGWRGLPTSARQADAIRQYIETYVKDGRFVGAPEGAKTLRPYILYWHLGQVLTQMGRNGMAVGVMRQALDDGEPGWNAYVMATISFLRKDRRDFDHWAPLARGNEETIKRLTAGWGLPYKQAYAGQRAVAESVLNETQTVTRIDSKPITDFGSNLKSYKHTDDWSQSGIDTGDDSYWQKRNIKPKVTKGLYAGDPRRTALYATGNAHETRYVEFTQNGQPIVYFDRKDLPKMRARKTYLTVFDATNFKKLPTGEYFSDNPGQPIKQTEIGDPFRYIASQGWIVRVTDNLDKVFKQVQAMHKAGKIAQYGAEGMNESVEDLDEVKMSPGALEKFATSDAAKGIRAGFEAELIFRDTQGESDEMDPEPDYDYDERAYSIQQVIEFFSNDEYGFGLSDRGVSRLENDLDETYMNWYDERVREDFGNEAEDLVREQHLDEMPMGERILAVLTDGMELTDDQAEKIFRLGSDAPRFTSSAEQEAFAEQNPDYRTYMEAVDDADAILDEEVETSIRKQDGYYDQAIDNFRDNYSPDSDSFFSDVGLRWMSDIANEYNLDWPVWNMDARGNDGSRDWDDIGASLQDAVDMPVKVSTNYHSTARREGTWIVEPDGSLSPDDQSEEAGLEIVSPPMPLLTAIEKLKQVTDWANDPNGGNAYTNSSTGLHMGVSLPRIKSEDANDSAGIDYVKLILFMGDKYVQQQFGREANTYCASALDKIKKNLAQGGDAAKSSAEGVVKLLKHGLTELAYRELQKGVGTSKYTSAHIQDGYIEFRSPGGDWLAKADEEIGILENTMLRFARAMAIAGDPSAERQEYAKKLYKLVTEGNEQYADQLKLFSEFSAGTIDKEQLKKQWAQQTLEKTKGDWQSSPTGKWEVYRDDIPTLDANGNEQTSEQTLEIIDADSRSDAVNKSYQKYTGVIPFKVRPYDPPEAQTPRAKLAKRIVKKPATSTQYNYEIVDQRTVELKVVDRFHANSDQEANRVFDRWLKMKDLPNDTADYGYRKGQQAADDQRDSVAIQRTLGVQDVDTDVAQNFEPRRQNYELVSDEDPNRVVHRMNDATADEVRAWIAQQEAGGMPPGFLRTRIVAEAIDPVSGAGAVPLRQDPKSISKKDIEPVAKVLKQPAKGVGYRSAIGQAITQKDLENMTSQIQMARRLGDSVMEMEDTPPEVLKALDQAAQKNGYKNWTDVKANPRSEHAVMTVAKLANAIMRTTAQPHHEKLFYKNKTDVDENFADGKVKGKSRPGRVKRAGASCSGSVTDLRARARKYGGEKGKMYHWCANMKAGRKK